MRAAVLEQFGGPLVMKQVEEPSMGPYEALIRVRNCGVCGSDLKIKSGKAGGPLPMIMGHEIAGEVVEVGQEVGDFQAGDRVVVNFYVTCGSCRCCRLGRTTLCPRVLHKGWDAPGGYAEYTSAPAVNLCKVPDHVPLEQACILGDAVVTSYHAVTKRADIHPGSTVALVGTGGVGLHSLQIAKLAGAWTIAIDINEDRLDLARKLGADAVVDARKGDFDREVRRLTGGEGVDVVIEFVAGAPPYRWRGGGRGHRVRGRRRDDGGQPSLPPKGRTAGVRCEHPWTAHEPLPPRSDGRRTRDRRLPSWQHSRASRDCEPGGSRPRPAHRRPDFPPRGGGGVPSAAPGG